MFIETFYNTKRNKIVEVWCIELHANQSEQASFQWSKQTYYRPAKG